MPTKRWRALMPYYEMPRRKTLEVLDWVSNR